MRKPCGNALGIGWRQLRTLAVLLLGLVFPAFRKLLDSLGHVFALDGSNSLQEPLDGIAHTPPFQFFVCLDGSRHGGKQREPASGGLAVRCEPLKRGERVARLFTSQRGSL